MTTTQHDDDDKKGMLISGLKLVFIGWNLSFKRKNQISIIDDKK